MTVPDVEREAILDDVEHELRLIVGDEAGETLGDEWYRDMAEKIAGDLADQLVGAVQLDELREIARDMYDGMDVGSPEQLAVSEFLGRAESLGGQP